MGILPTRGPLFLGLNALRVLGIIALVLVFAATVVTIVDDIKAVKAAKAPSPSSSLDKRRVLIVPVYQQAMAGSVSTTTTTNCPTTTNSPKLKMTKQALRQVSSAWYDGVVKVPSVDALSDAKMFAEVSSASSASSTSPSSASSTSPSPTSPPTTTPTPHPTCDYYTSSTVPSQTGGTFWSVLSRIFILFETTILILSETTFPLTLFTSYIPMLGPDYGLGLLGVLQALIASSVLSHHCRLFPQISSWLLFIVAMSNILVGIFMREKVKITRSLSWENVAEVTPQTKAIKRVWQVGSGVHEAVKEWKAGTEGSRPSFYSQNTPAPTMAPTVAPTRNNRFSWESARSTRWGAWKARSDVPTISRPIELDGRRLV